MHPALPGRQQLLQSYGHQQQQPVLLLPAAAAAAPSVPVVQRWPLVFQQAYGPFQNAASVPMCHNAPGNAAVDAGNSVPPAAAATAQQQHPVGAYQALNGYRYQQNQQQQQQQQHMMTQRNQQPLPAAAADCNGLFRGSQQQQQQQGGLVLEYLQNTQPVNTSANKVQQLQQPQQQRTHSRPPVALNTRATDIVKDSGNPVMNPVPQPGAVHQQQQRRQGQQQHGQPVARVSHIDWCKSRFPICCAGLPAAHGTKLPPGLQPVANSSSTTRHTAAAAAAAGPTGGTTRLSAALEAVGWSAHIAQSAHQGRTYYYNKYTKVSTWRNPDEQQQQQQCDGKTPNSRVDFLTQTATAAAAAAAAAPTGATGPHVDDGGHGKQSTVCGQEQQQAVSHTHAPMCRRPAATATARAGDADAATDGDSAAAAAADHDQHEASTAGQDPKQQQQQQQQTALPTSMSDAAAARSAAHHDLTHAITHEIITHDNNSANPGQQSPAAAAAAGSLPLNGVDCESDLQPTVVFDCCGYTPKQSAAAAATSRDPADQEVGSKRDVSNAQPDCSTAAAAAAAEADAAAANQQTNGHTVRLQHDAVDNNSTPKRRGRKRGRGKKLQYSDHRPSAEQHNSMFARVMRHTSYRHDAPRPAAARHHNRTAGSRGLAGVTGNGRQDQQQRYSKDDRVQQRGQRERPQQQHRHIADMQRHSRIDNTGYRRSEQSQGGVFRGGRCHDEGYDGRQTAGYGSYNRPVSARSGLQVSNPSSKQYRVRGRFDRTGDRQGDSAWQQQDEQGRAMFDALDAGSNRYPMADPNEPRQMLASPRSCRLPIDSLARDLRDAVLEVCEQSPANLLSPEHFDEAVVRVLNDVGLSKGMYVLRCLARKSFRDLRGVRNMPGFLMAFMLDVCQEEVAPLRKKCRKR